MESVLASLVGLIAAAAIYLILSRALIRVLLGIMLLGNSVILLIFVAGRLTTAVPPIVPKGATVPGGAAASTAQNGSPDSDGTRHETRSDGSYDGSRPPVELDTGPLHPEFHDETPCRRSPAWAVYPQPALSIFG